MQATTRRGLLSGAAWSAAATALGTSPGAAVAASGRVREYWIAAEPFTHCLAPTGKDLTSGAAIDRKLATITALRYRAYSAGWGRPLPGNGAIGPNTGMPGPTLRAHPGDLIGVHFRNDDNHYRMNHGMHPHGVFYTPANDGAEIMSDPGRHRALAPGRSYTYEWRVRPDSVGTWVYHDHTMSPPLPGVQPDYMAVGPPMSSARSSGCSA